MQSITNVYRNVRVVLACLARHPHALVMLSQTSTMKLLLVNVRDTQITQRRQTALR